MEDRAILQGLADNDALMQVVRTLLEQQFSMDRMTVDDSDMLLGQMVRARLVGLKAIDDAFKEISHYKSTPLGVDKINPAY